MRFSKMKHPLDPTKAKDGYSDRNKGYSAVENKDYEAALKEWEPLALQGDADAQFNMGLMHKKGQGVPQDYEKTIKWYKLAAEQGLAPAQSNLGFMYYNGNGVPRDDKIAVKWYKLAAEQGYDTAQYSLGLMYYQGEGIQQDYIRAHMWWNIATLQGYADARKNRDRVEEKMSPSQLESARRLARDWMEKHE